MDAKFHKLSNEINHKVIIRTHCYFFYEKLGGVFNFSERNMTLRHFLGFIHSIRDVSGVIEPSEHDGCNFKPFKILSSCVGVKDPQKLKDRFAWACVP